MNKDVSWKKHTHTGWTTTILRPFFRDHPGELVPEENFSTVWCKGRLTDADINHPAGRHSIRTNQCQLPPSPLLQAGCPSCHPTNSVKALKDYTGWNDNVISCSFFMVTLCNRETIYIFMLWFVLSFFSSPNLSRRRLDVCHTSPHGVALVRI